MLNLNRRGSMSVTSINNGSLDSVFTEESGSTCSGSDDGFANGLIPRTAVSLSVASKKNDLFLSSEKRDLTRSRSLPEGNQITNTANYRRNLPELEALEACYWLRAAGFPQYAQMYEDSLFPIDIAHVAKDHDFLDQDSIEALFRRLQTLNNCARLKLHPRKVDEYDSDDEDLIALSSRWKLQRKNRKWSRIKRSDDNLKVTIGETNSNCSSKDSKGYRSPIKENDKNINVNINNNGNNAALELLYLRLNERRPSLYDNLPINNNSRNSFSKSSQIMEGSCDTEVHSPVAKRRPGSDRYSSNNSTVGDPLESSTQDHSTDEEDVTKDLELVKSLNNKTIPTGKPRVKKARWHSFQRVRDPQRDSTLPSLKISHLSGGQLAVLRKLSLLKLTALIERYSTVHRGIGWSVPRIFKKIISPDYKGKKVFGVPLSVNVQRNGHSLPKPILCAISYLRRTALQSVGLFRRSGGKQRIHQLKSLIEEDLDTTNFGDWGTYDIADVLKIYFRELPEPLLTNKLADTFLSIHQHVPKELRLGAMQAVVLLMPDENREALQTLLLFLNDVAQESSVNQMNSNNLAVCFVPAFFHLCGASEDLIGHPKRVKRTVINKAAKELTSGLDAQECITQMITDVKKLFSIPQDTMMKCKFSYIEQGEPVRLEELGRADGYTDDGYQSYLETCIASLLKESRLKFKSWLTYTWPEAVPSIEVSYKKVRDGYPLRLWRATTEIDADPEVILKRIVHERHLWDEELISWDVIEQLSENTQVFRYVTQTVLLHPPRDHVVLRTWRTDIDNGKCAIVSTSVAHPEANVAEGVRATVLASRYLIEPIEPGRSRLTHVYRVDLRGRTPDWYNAAMPPLLANSIQRIKNSFFGNAADLETNV